MQISSSSKITIERLQSPISYQEFFQKFLIPNKPCILPAKLIQDWNAYKLWQNESQEDCIEGLHPAFGILKKQYGHHKVPVVIEKVKGSVHCEGGQGEDDSVEREEMTLDEAIERMAQAKKQGDERIYVKDWHLMREEGKTQNSDSNPIYFTPSIFSDDWMNNIQSQTDDDFRFCYAGSIGTRTSIHRDVYTSYSWSTNICGKKLWRLFPPKVKTFLRKYPNNSNSEIASNVDEMEKYFKNEKFGIGYPKWKEAMKNCFEIIQEQGETIFVPSDWFHEVINLTDCISLNHNWCNSCNIKSMYESICEEITKTEEVLIDVQKMIQDSNPQNWKAEWNETVQKVVIVNAGWAWDGFWNMVRYNLVFPPCEQSLRPNLSFIRSQLQPCIEDFVLRYDYEFIGKETKKSVEKCREILEI